MGAWQKKTSLWKFDSIMGGICTEFDCLAVLENMLHETSYDTHACKGGVMLHELPINYEALDKYYAGTVLSKRSTYFEGANFDILFVKEIDTSLRSLCSCDSVGYNERNMVLGHLDKDAYGKSSTNGCYLCEVNTPTGILRVNPSIPVVRDIDNKGPEKCSLILEWTSKANSLVVFDPLFLDQPQTLTSFPIYVDFLPTVELFKQNLFGEIPMTDPSMSNLHGRDTTVDLFVQNFHADDPVFESSRRNQHATDPWEQLICQLAEQSVRPTRTIQSIDSPEHECFIVPKRCCICDSTYEWRKSSSRSEIAYIVNEMSETHRKCYMIIKCIVTFADRYFNHINSYHIKNIAMNHSKRCSAASASCAECVLKMFNELLTAYQKETLKSFNLGVNIFDKLRGDKADSIAIIKKCIEALNSASEFACLYTLMMALM